MIVIDTKELTLHNPSDHTYACPCCGAPQDTWEAYLSWAESSEPNCTQYHCCEKCSKDYTVECKLTFIVRAKRSEVTA